MPAIIAAIAGGALAAGGSIGSGAMQAGGSASAANAAKRAQLAAWGITDPIYRQSLGYLDPYRKAGTDALWRLRDLMGYTPGASSASGGWLQPITYGEGEKTLKDMLGFGMPEAFSDINQADLRKILGYDMSEAFRGVSPRDISRLSGVDWQKPFDPVTLKRLERATGQDYQSLLTPMTGEQFLAGIDPGYQWRQDQAQQAIERSAAARGNVLGGGTLRDLQDRSQGLASQEYQAAWDRDMARRTMALQEFASTYGRMMGNKQNAQAGLSAAAAALQNQQGARQAGIGSALGLLETNKARQAAGLGFAQNVRNTNLANQWANRNFQYSALADLLNQGASAASGSANLAGGRASAGMGVGQNIGATAAQAGLAGASGWANALQGVSNAAQGTYGNYLLADYMRNKQSTQKYGYDYGTGSEMDNWYF